MGDRWACLIVDRASRFVVAHTTGQRGAERAERAIGRARARTGGRLLAWCSDGWRPHPAVITRAYRRPVHTGKRGRPPLRVPAGVALTQPVKHRDRRGRLVRVETRAAIGPPVAAPTPAHVERLNGALRDRLAALTRRTHAFAKTAATWEVLVGLALFEHNWLRSHPACAGRRPRRAVATTGARRRWPSG